MHSSTSRHRGADDQRRRQLDVAWPTRRASRVIWASIRVSDTNQLDGESGVWRFLGALGQPLGCAKTLSTPNDDFTNFNRHQLRHVVAVQQ